MKVTVIGLGPGGGADLTGRARAALEECDLLVGYTAYIDLVKEDFPDKETLSTGMRREVDRCRAAVEAALTGKNVAVVCSGDSGVYGMAGLIYEVAQEYDPIDIEVVPGITAACGGAAVLGAPLTHDFAVVSLSDLLTPWEKIEARLTAAARADFVLCLYNPASRSRPDYLRRACDILLAAGKSPDTVCGTVRNIGRAGEEARILTLGRLRDTQVDMFTTVFVGNSQTKVLGGKMVTPRGYFQREN
ncbi:precorrin-3B C(17)-methyltransferase [Flavonifractor sp. An10]|uniref:precorrin-3B C(17)-methyltransferase n=1 Tax=Flavonifractor sp. An10 TaxID=1965537 RepID=UPI000B3962B3|nr:precorrin-3B C(17)-methyltransferase [Flavonifractor sp. An10]OUQ82585.1 precorrin-3B C(17)-methyltransferase [Flavonifractor sp. An10]